MFTVIGLMTGRVVTAAGGRNIIPASASAGVGDRMSEVRTIQRGGNRVSETNDSDEYEYCIVHDSLGVSHVMRHKKGVHPAIRCADCD